MQTYQITIKTANKSDIDSILSVWNGRPHDKDEKIKIKNISTYSSPPPSMEVTVTAEPTPPSSLEEQSDSSLEFYASILGDCSGPSTDRMMNRTSTRSTSKTPTTRLTSRATGKTAVKPSTSVSRSTPIRQKQTRDSTATSPENTKPTTANQCITITSKTLQEDQHDVTDVLASIIGNVTKPELEGNPVQYYNNLVIGTRYLNPAIIMHHNDGVCVRATDLHMDYISWCKSKKLEYQGRNTFYGNFPIPQSIAIIDRRPVHVKCLPSSVKWG